jgi:RNA polymerase sigma factor (sigma-70 family)
MSTQPDTLLDPNVVINAAETALKSFIKSQRGTFYMCKDDFNEIVQRVCLKAYIREETYNPERGTIATWVNTMTRTTIYDYLNERSYKGRWAEGCDPSLYDKRRATTPSDTYEFNETIVFVDDYKSGLRDIKQKMFCLMMKEVPNKEIARECNMSENAVNAAISRMRTDMRSKIRRLDSFYGSFNCAS